MKEALFISLLAMSLTFALVSATCGNGTIEGTDMCDDNNNITGDGCNDTCQIEIGYVCEGEPSICSPVCGDGLIIATESCDDNDTMTGDGCNDTCQIETGFECIDQPSVCFPICGDALILGTEQCDDNGDITGDGCNDTCQIEIGYSCKGQPSICGPVCGDGIRIIAFEECDDGNLNPNDGCSNCRVILLDLNIPDNTTLSYSNEYFELNEVVFLFDPNNTNLSSFFLSEDGGNWTHLYLVVLNGVESIDVSVDIYPTQALAAGRTPFYSARSRPIFQGDPQGRLANLDINATEVVAGMEFTGDDETSPDGDEQFSRQEIAAALDSIGYIAREHPDYVPREVCVIARDSVYSSMACVTLYFIGRNDDPPVVSYTPDATAQFVEGQTDFVQIVAGSLVVTDEDHPTRYLMMSARAVIMGFMSSYPEQLSVTYEHPNFNYNFDPSDGELTISGNGTADLYSQLLANITYHNDMTEPTGATRTIRVTVFDGVHNSNEQSITVEIVNVNDAPVVSLDGTVPVVTEGIVTYTEGNGEREVVRRLVVIDTDPFAMIQRATVTLTNAVDTEFETITIGANLTGLGLTLDTTTSNRFEVTGVATQEVYSNILRSLTYRHGDSNPGNPTQEPARLVEFSVEDETSTTSATSLLSILITPVNDAPILSIVSDPALRDGPLILDGQTESTYMYLEDDQPLNIGVDIYLRDVDSNISSVTIYATGLVNGVQDRLLFTSLYDITLNVTELGDGNRSIVLSGEATPQVYEQVLRTLSYQNGYTNNSVTDGRRTIAIVAEDTLGVRSGVMYIVTNIFVMDRNDGPDVNLGNGVNVDHTITFTEGGSSIPITQTFLTSLTDEEGHNISRMTVELIAVNGLLDLEEALFFRTPNPLQADFLGFIDEESGTFISITVNASVSLYQEALTSIFYLNAREEPSVYNASTGNDRLIRVIVINITDANYIDPNTDPADATDADMGVSTTTARIGVQIDTINDNRPMILIRSDPDSCSTDSRDSTETDMAGTRRRRDIRSVSRIQKKSILMNSKKDLTIVMAPKIVSAIPVFTNTTQPSTKCLQQVTVTFNTDTSAPVVEMPSVIGDVISFDPPHLDSAKKYGQWMDYRTLVVIFMGDCIEVEVETTSGKTRPIFVAFMAEQGECDWDTPCTSGVCFRNETGCPMVTYIHISMPTTTPDPAPETTQAPGSQPQSHLMALLYNFCIAAVVLLIALLVVFTCTTACRKRSNRSPAVIKQVEISHPTSTLIDKHVQDLPVVVTFNPSTIVTKPTSVPTQANPIESRQQATKNSNIKSQQEDEKPLLEDSSEAARTPVLGRTTESTTSKKRSPGKKGEKQQPKAKRKPPFGKDSKPIEVPATNERLQDVVTSCDHSSPVSLGPSAIVRSRREQYVEYSKHHHTSQTTTVKNGTRENDQSV